MRSRALGAITLAVIVSFSVTSCSPVQQIEAISTAQTCAKVEELVTGMATVLIQLAVNPLALPRYEERLRDLSSDLRDLRPLDEELNSSVDEVADGVDQILDSTDLSNPLNLAGLPSGIATVQGSLKEVLDTCEQLVAA
jgi:DNA repair ATPase RecN